MYISNVRLVKGTAVYTSDFIPPTRQLTNVTNTKLLCCQSTVEPGGVTVSPGVSGINNGTQWSNTVRAQVLDSNQVIQQLTHLMVLYPISETADQLLFKVLL